MQVIRNRDVWKKGQNDNKDMYNRFNNEIFHILASETLKMVQHNCSILNDKCINDARKVDT